MKTGRHTLVISFLILLFFAVASWAEMVVQACFSPQGKCSGYIVREIDKAQKELLVAVYAFTSEGCIGPDRARPGIRCHQRKIAR